MIRMTFENKEADVYDMDIYLLDSFGREGYEAIYNHFEEKISNQPEKRDSDMDCLIEENYALVSEKMDLEDAIKKTARYLAEAKRIDRQKILKLLGVKR
jgi:hypothetical protein